MTCPTPYYYNYACYETCPAFLSRATNNCVATCSHINSTICEVPGAPYCEVYELTNSSINQYTCFHTCAQPLFTYGSECYITCPTPYYYNYVCYETCPAFLSRASNNCVATCSYINGSICEVPGAPYCEVY